MTSRIDRFSVNPVIMVYSHQPIVKLAERIPNSLVRYLKEKKSLIIGDVSATSHRARHLTCVELDVDRWTGQ